MPRNLPIVNVGGTSFVPEARGVEFTSVGRDPRQTTQDVEQFKAGTRQMRKDVASQELQLNEVQMAQGFRELLRTGLEGASAYVQELKQEDEELGAEAEAQLQSIAPVFQDPNLTGQRAQSVLENWYKGVDTRRRLKNEPDFYEKLEAQKQKRISTEKEMVRIRKRTESDKKREYAKLHLPSAEENLRLEMEKPELRVADFVPRIAEMEAQLENAKANLERLQGQTEKEVTPTSMPTPAGFVVPPSPTLPKKKITTTVGTQKEIDKAAKEVRDLQSLLNNQMTALKQTKSQELKRYDQAVKERKDNIKKRITEINQIRKAVGLPQLRQEQFQSRTTETIEQEIGEATGSLQRKKVAKPRTSSDLRAKIAEGEAYLKKNPGDTEVAEIIKLMKEKLGTMGAQ